MSQLNKYQLDPPAWQEPFPTRGGRAGGTQQPPGTTTATTSANSEQYLQFFPTRPHQLENQLTPLALKAGFVSKAIVQTETFSAHQLIYEKLQRDPTILAGLVGLLTQVQQQSSAHEFPPSLAPAPPFKLPSRVTLHEQKREAWIDDLANPAIPLLKLSRNIPHGYKGVKLLEMLFNRGVNISRAVWYIRTVGGIEVHAQKNRNAFNLASYNLEWTNIICEFISDQLATPPPPKGIVNKGKGKAKESSTPAGPRELWLAKFTYTQHLISALYTENLLDQALLLKFLITQVQTCSLQQLFFTLILVNDYLDEMVKSEVVASLLVGRCLDRLFQIESIPNLNSSAAQTNLQNSLTKIIQFCFFLLPDSFLPLPQRHLHSERMQSLLLALHPLVGGEGAEEAAAGQRELFAQACMKSDWDRLQKRDHMSRGLIKVMSDSSEVKNNAQGDVEGGVILEIIQILDDIQFPSSISQTHALLFKPQRRSSLALPPSTSNSSTSVVGAGGAGSRDTPLITFLNLSFLFDWAVTKDRRGEYRIFAVAALLACEKSWSAERAEEGSRTKMDVVGSFIKWIDTCITPTRNAGLTGTDKEHERSTTLEPVKVLLAELIRTGGIGYETYLQKMIARGDTEVTSLNQNDSIHLYLLQSVALLGSSQIQRRLTLRNTSMTERGVESKILLAAQSAVHNFIHPTVSNTVENVQELYRLVHNLGKTGNQLQITRIAIPHAIAQSPPISVSQFSILQEVYKRVGDYAGLLSFIKLLLSSSPIKPLLHALLNCITTHLLIFTSMNALAELGTSLMTVYDYLGSGRGQDRRLTSLVRSLGRGGWVGKQDFERVEEEWGKLVTSLGSKVALPTLTPPSTLIPELVVLSSSLALQGISELATTVWYKYHSFTNWGSLVVSQSVNLLLSAAPLQVKSGDIKIHDRVDRMFYFLREIHERLGGGLDSILHASFSVALQAASRTTEGQLNDLLIRLVEEGIVGAAGVLKDIILPSWKACLGSRVAGSDDMVTSMNLVKLLDRLIGSVECGGEGAEEKNQLCRARRTELFSRDNLPTLGSCMSCIILLQEYAGLEDDENKEELSRVFGKICQVEEFKLLVGRWPAGLAKTMLDYGTIAGVSQFGQAPRADVGRRRILKGLLYALRCAASDSQSTPTHLVTAKDWNDFISTLTLWRLNHSKIQVSTYLEDLALDESISAEIKAVTLSDLAGRFLERVAEAGEEESYLGEAIVECFTDQAASELASAAFLKLAQALSQLSDADADDVNARGLALRVLHSTGRLVGTHFASGSVSQCHPEAIKSLLAASCTAISKAVALSSTSPEDQNSSDLAVWANYLLGVCLRWSRAGKEDSVATVMSLVDNAESREAFREVLEPMAKLALISATALPTHAALPTALLDTCSQILYHLYTPTATLPIQVPTIASLFTPETSPLIPDDFINRLIQIFTPLPFLLIPHANPWELIDHTPAPPVHQSAVNVAVPQTPLPLASFSARIIAAVPRENAGAGDAVDRVPPPPIPGVSKANSSFQPAPEERGLQTNFDEELSYAGISYEGRSWRRGMMIREASTWIPPSEEDKAEAEARGVVGVEVVQSVSGGSSSRITRQRSSSSTPLVATAGGSGSRGTKRKEPQSDILILSDGDSPAAVVPPPAKRVSTGGKAPATKKKAVAGKGVKSTTTAGKAVKARKKPKN